MNTSKLPLEISIHVNELLSLSSRLKERERELLEVQEGFSHSYYKASSHYPDIEQLDISYHAASIKLQIEKLIETMAQLAEITRLTPDQLSTADQHSAEQMTQI
ncbi:hypothetical protein J9317_08385 [Metabacillus sp. KIGAM252]|uniref:Uncharacterized protein n=1 Tax=Metabacillus flavus TaxID=2823519 RepID=A0ABS5LDF3_9BACI|nr:hypothetical protein [Metabacillus flavus]MBS2968772.1 hypothetical protein [Metabacillus flavus]